jgi:hypothetical protein
MPKPPLQFTRPARPETRDEQQRDLRPAPSPAIDLDSPEVQAFSLRGRVTVPPSIKDGAGEGAHSIAPPVPSPAPALGREPSLPDNLLLDDPWRHVAVKLPAVSGRKLSEVADLRCSKRTRVALEVLRRPLRDLARAHRTGEYPPLRRVSAGVSRSGVSLILPQDLADDLRYVVETRGAVKAQILARLLVPEIDALYLKEILGRH